MNSVIKNVLVCGLLVLGMGSFTQAQEPTSVSETMQPPVKGGSEEALFNTLNETLEENRKIRVSMKEIQQALQKKTIESEDLKYTLISLLSSSLFFVHYITWSSCQVINSRDFELPFDFNSISSELKTQLVKLGKRLQKDLQENSVVQVRNYSARGRSFTMEKQYFYIKKSKAIIDEIDTVLAKHYGFTNEELDFIINYDIKNRLGKDLENEDEE